MAAKKKGLGRGLDALLGDVVLDQAAVPVAKKESETTKASTSEQSIEDGALRHIPVEWCSRGKYQPRKDMNAEALEELANSIRQQGVMQPIVIRPIAQNQYEIIAGERRWRAAQQAGLDTIPAVVRTVPDESAIAMALIENIQREDLNPMEEAEALTRLQSEFSLTHQQIAEVVGKSRTTVTNLMRLNALTTEVKRLLENGDIDMGHARALLSLPESQQADAARDIVNKGLTVRQTESLVNQLLYPKTNTNKDDAVDDANIKRLQSDLSDKLGVPVMVSHSAKGSGKLVLKYNSLDELDGILAHIK